MLNALHTLSSLVLTLVLSTKYYDYPHYINEKTEDQQGEVNASPIMQLVSGKARIQIQSY